MSGKPREDYKKAKNSLTDAAERWPEQCRRVVSELTSKQDWRLIDAGLLVERVLAEAGEDESEAMLRRRAVHHYSQVLYAACAQTADGPRRERAFHELHRYLYRAAYNRWPEQAEDITQQAVLIVAEQLARCRHPGTFLSFSLFKCKDAAQRVQRDEGRWRERTRTLDETIPGANQESPVFSVLAGEGYEAVQQAIMLLPERLQAVLVLKYQEEYDDVDIARTLGITVNYVRVLRNRARKQLRNMLHFEDGVQPSVMSGRKDAH